MIYSVQYFNILDFKGAIINIFIVTIDQMSGMWKEWTQRSSPDSISLYLFHRLSALCLGLIANMFISPVRGDNVPTLLLCVCLMCKQATVC